MSLLGWRQWAVDRDGLLRPAWTPWSPYPAGLLLWRPDGLTRARCLRRPPDAAAPADPRAVTRDGPRDAPAEARDDGAGARRVPDERCACGLYAWRDPGELARAPYPRWTSLPIVLGAVRLGGRIIVGERGYRAEVGYPVAVLDPRDVLAAAYPVARYRDWRALIAEWHAEAPPAAA